MRIKETEDKLQRDSKVFLDATLPNDAVWFHVPNGEHRNKATAGKLKLYGVLAGVADWVIVHSGKVIFLELKTERGRLSDKQIDFRQRAISAGAHYFVCRSLLEIQLALEASGISGKAKVAA